MMEQRLRAGATPETQSFRDLYNLWVRCAEEIYSQLAHSDAFCKLQADLGNATLRLRAQQQKLIEQWLKQFDLPTRAEINSVHLQLKQMRERVTQLERVATAESRPVEKSAPLRAKAKRKGTKTSVTRE
jgi:class III poly(R)-hydroxyalkanoic acid synthase PhaE subunit